MPSATLFILIILPLLPVPVSMKSSPFISVTFDSMIIKTSVSGLLTMTLSQDMLTWNIRISASWWLLLSSWTSWVSSTVIRKASMPEVTKILRFIDNKLNQFVLIGVRWKEHVPLLDFRIWQNSAKCQFPLTPPVSFNILDRILMIDIKYCIDSWRVLSQCNEIS